MGADAHSKCGEYIQLQTSAMHSCIKDMLKPALKHKATFNWQEDNLLFLFPHIHTYHLPSLGSHEYSLLETSPFPEYAKVYNPCFCYLLSEWAKVRVRTTLSWKLTWFQDNTVSLCCSGSKFAEPGVRGIKMCYLGHPGNDWRVLKWIKCWLYQSNLNGKINEKCCADSAETLKQQIAALSSLMTGYQTAWLLTAWMVKRLDLRFKIKQGKMSLCSICLI